MARDSLTYDLDRSTIAANGNEGYWVRDEPEYETEGLDKLKEEYLLSPECMVTWR